MFARLEALTRAGFAAVSKEGEAEAFMRLVANERFGCGFVRDGEQEESGLMEGDEAGVVAAAAFCCLYSLQSALRVHAAHVHMPRQHGHTHEARLL